MLCIYLSAISSCFHPWNGFLKKDSHYTSISFMHIATQSIAIFLKMGSDHDPRPMKLCVG